MRLIFLETKNGNAAAGNPDLSHRQNTLRSLLRYRHSLGHPLNFTSGSRNHKSLKIAFWRYIMVPLCVFFLPAPRETHHGENEEKKGNVMKIGRKKRKGWEKRKMYIHTHTHTYVTESSFAAQAAQGHSRSKWRVSPWHLINDNCYCNLGFIRLRLHLVNSNSQFVIDCSFF